MALFEPDDRIEPERPRRPRRRSVTVGWILLAASLVIAIILGVAPAPYVIEKPGPVFDTLGTTEHDGKKVPLISIPDEKTYATGGSLDLLTVSLLGNPDSRPSWFQIVQSFFSPQDAVLPIDAVFAPDVTTEQRDAQNQADMVNSQQDAIAAALTELGYDFPREVTVASTAEGSPADGVLVKGDIIDSVNGTEVHDIQALRDAVADNGPDKAATIDYTRDGKKASVAITPVQSGDAVILGVNVMMHYEFPIDVEIELDNVGGPSAGMMFALGIIDKLTPGKLNGGERVAGTGTIDSVGTVGPIGGIRQKMYGAKSAGATFFLAPDSNCDEVTGHIPSGLTVFSVKTLDDSLAALKAVAGGGDTSSLPTCPAG